MTKQQRTGLIVAFIGLVLFLISQTIDTPWNSGESMFDSTDNYQENIVLKRVLQFLGIGLLVFGGIMYISKKIRARMIIAIILMLLGSYLTIFSSYGILYYLTSSNKELVENMRDNAKESGNERLMSLTERELFRPLQKIKKRVYISNTIALVIGLGIGLWGYYLFRKDKRLKITATNEN